MAPPAALSSSSCPLVRRLLTDVDGNPGASSGSSSRGDKQAAVGVNGGWLVLTLEPRHVTGPQLDQVRQMNCSSPEGY